MDKPDFSENISLTEEVVFETQTDPVIFRKELIRHLNRYQNFYNQNELVHAYIYLQIYAESFLHNYMRHIVAFEFKPPRNKTILDWYASEQLFIPQKIDNFISLFFNPLPIEATQYITQIKTSFKFISEIRNLFAHGHKISVGINNKGRGVMSPAASKLAPWEFQEALEEFNKLCLSWNNLLLIIQARFKALRQIRDFKLKRLTTQVLMPHGTTKNE